MNTKFPIFLKPENLTFNVFGGSEIAEEKLHFLLKGSPHAKVRVFAKTCSPLRSKSSSRATARFNTWPDGGLGPGNFTPEK